LPKAKLIIEKGVCMLEKIDFIAWATKLKLSEKTQNYISSIRNSEPSRRVKSSKGAVIGTFPSRKMGVTIQFESHKNELPFIHELEHASNVIEYYDQPLPFKLEYESLSGRKLAHSHTPDFFVIYEDYAAWIECKTEEQLLNLSIKQPNRFQRDDKGVWRCPPGERYAEQFGLKYVVRSNKEINWNYQRNIEFLDDYYRSDISSISERAKQEILFQVRSEIGISLEQLFEKTLNEVTKDDIFFLIALNEIYVDLYSSPLIESKNVKVFVDRESAQAYSNVINFPSDKSSQVINMVEVSVGEQVNWDGQIWQIANVGLNFISLVNESNFCSEVPILIFEELVRIGNIKGVSTNKVSLMPDEVKEKLALASPEDLIKANRKYQILIAYFQGLPLPENIPLRTLRDWKLKDNRAEKTYGYGYIGLLPKPRPGNQTERLSDESNQTMNDFISNDYETLKQKKKFEVYAAFRAYCEEKGVEPPSYKTFIEAIKKRSRYDRTLNRQGRRAAYNAQPFYYSLEQETPRHGERPFHIVHIDHTELDVELNDSETGENFGRPWLTLMIDAFSRLILAAYLTFDKPSYRSCMMVIRECVKRHGRFPQILVVDGGKEFSSVYFETLLAIFECVKKTRPPAESRFGSLIERMFFTNNTQFVHNLQGNTQIMKNVRQVTKSVNPKNQALWYLTVCYEYARKYCYEVYPSLKHSTLGQTPAEMFTMGNQLAGERKHKIISYTEDFKILTFPAVKVRSGTAKVVPSKGVKINYIFYWNPVFTNPDVEGNRIPVRYDPFDTGHCYAYVNKQWMECLSEHYNTFKGCSEKLITLASEELKRKAKFTTKDFNLNASKLAALLNSIENEEAILRQKRYDREQLGVLSVINASIYQSNPQNDSVNTSAENEISHLESEILNAEDFSSEYETYQEF
jgi:putative transposase